MVPCVLLIFVVTGLATTTTRTRCAVVLQLTHYSLSTSRFNSTEQLLKSTASRSSQRLANRQAPVGLSLGGGDYTMSISLGGGAAVSLYMDTGSDLVWVPCKPFTCILCEGKAAPWPHDAGRSSRVSCQSRACSSAHSGRVPASHLCAMSRCPLDAIEVSDCQSYACPSFYYAYADGSFVGRLHRDALRLHSSTAVANFTFACAHEALAEPVGVAGFGRGPLSLPAQLGSRLGSRFSYCLVPHSFDPSRVAQPSPLIFGREVNNSQPFAYTPMLENPKRPYYYYVGLEAVTVGQKRITAPLSTGSIDAEGNGGMVVDSGTTYSVLPQELYNSVVAEFGRKSGYERAQRLEDKTGLTPCYYTVKPLVPQLVLHFRGNSSLVLPRRNYFYQFTDDGENVNRQAGCVTLMNAGFFLDSGGPAGLLGNYQQQGLEVVYDLIDKRVGFARRKCSSLWDTLA